VDKNRSRLRPPSSPAALLGAVVTIGFVGLFVCWPVLRLFAEGASTSAIGDVLGSSRIRTVIWFTIWQAALSTVGTLLLSLPGAWLVGTHRFRGRQLLVAIWSAPFVLPSVVVGAAFLALLPERWERSIPALISAHIFFNVGMATRVIGEAWASLDERFEQTAATLGAPVGAQRRLALRLLLPTVASVAGVVGSLCLTSFAIVRILGGLRHNTVETEIWRQTTERLALDKASVLAVVQIVLVVTVLLVTSRARTGASVAKRSLKSAPTLATAVIISALTITTLTPILLLANRALNWPGSGRTFRAFDALRSVTPGSGLLGTPLHAIATSLRNVLLATVLSVVMAGFATLGGAKRSRFVTALTLLPMAVSAVTLGLGTILAFARSPLAWRSSWWMVPVLQAVVAFPFAVRILRPAADAIDPQLRIAAQTLGASPIAAWWRVDGLLLRVPFRSAIGLSAAIALGEFGASSFLVRPRSETIPVAIGVLSSRPGGQLQAQAAALAVTLALMTMALSSISGRGRLGRQQ
jgi:thiamine transport system permease protein